MKKGLVSQETDQSFSIQAETLKPAPHERPSRQTLKFAPHGERPSTSLITQSATSCKSLSTLIEGRTGTRAGSEDYGQYDKKII